MRRIATTAIMLCVLAAAATGAMFAYFMFHAIRAPVAIDEPVTFRIPAGSSPREIDSRLDELGLLPFAESFRLLARLRDVDKKMKSGNYLIEPPSVSLEQLLEKFTSGEVVSERFTIIEGETFASVVEKIRANPMFRHTLEGPTNDVAAQIGIEREHPEGMLFPDTYLFQEGVTDASLLKAAHESLTGVLAQEWEARQPDLPLETPYEALVLASIIEKEAASVEEMTTVSSVFINRLRKGMRLQADPTVIYGMGKDYQGNITKADLKRDTPYNTYTRNGLPPTPIAVSGRAAIHAALNPADTDYLYFVATRDGSRHLVSRTLREHINAVNKHQK